ncbi:unnamed protein product [Mytilus edulis]|uniref:DZIP3-like HEPN domain-containing protein n=1 Tax=Mytilus edulis TaxID=6550 RepID=A0A8S3QPF7_MYTED|nr:unnamed protein product [Mytilus edulis]
MNKSTIRCKPIIIERASKDGNQNRSVDIAVKIILQVQIQFSRYQKRKSNFVRCYILCQELASESVRIYCTRQFPEPTLAVHLNDLRRKTNVNRRKCASEESSILSPAKNSNVQLTEFEFTLLYKLIRNNMTSLHEPTHGWGSQPSQKIQEKKTI